MPKLLKGNIVQLHMPRTGGVSLQKQKGLVKTVGTMHDGPEKIPAAWKNFPTVTTYRGKADWTRSMYDYLLKIGKKTEAVRFAMCVPDEVRAGGIDPTFGLWDDKNESFKKLAIARFFHSWYELYLSYFVDPADEIIPIKKLKYHLNKT